MITNKEVLRVRNRKFFLLFAGMAFFVIALIISIAYAKENNISTTMNKINKSKSNRYDLKATAEINYISDPFEYGKNKKYSYYIVSDGKKYTIVYMSKSDVEKLRKKDLEKKSEKVVGRSTLIPVELKKMIMDYYNKDIPYESADYLSDEDFEDFLGTAYLDTSKTNSKNAESLSMFMYLFLTLGVGASVISLFLLIKFNKSIKRFDENDYGFMEIEIDESETARYPNYNLYLTSHYVIWLPNSFNACKYEDIVWMFPDQNNNVTTGLKIFTKDSKMYKILTLKGTPTNEDNIAIQDVWNRIYQKNRNIALGYTDENIARFSVKK